MNPSWAKYFSLHMPSPIPPSPPPPLPQSPYPDVEGEEVVSVRSLPLSGSHVYLVVSGGCEGEGPSPLLQPSSTMEGRQMLN